MSKKKDEKPGRGKRQTDWAEAKRLCRLNQQDAEMAKELGISPRSLIKNIPSPSQPWKAPVRYWIRELYEKKKQQKKAAEKKLRPPQEPPADTETKHVHEPPPDTGDDFASDGTAPSDIPF
ncbi:MAG TPA: hypothetical protein VMY37_14590 [Thermoguttaceae bacterium]|nr:hypothetical protein [Thermoguttaceae bacterium]